MILKLEMKMISDFVFASLKSIIYRVISLVWAAV